MLSGISNSEVISSKKDEKNKIVFLNPHSLKFIIDDLQKNDLANLKQTSKFFSNFISDSVLIKNIINLLSEFTAIDSKRLEKFLWNKWEDGLYKLTHHSKLFLLNFLNSFKNKEIEKTKQNEIANQVTQLITILNQEASYSLLSFMMYILIVQLYLERDIAELNENSKKLLKDLFNQLNEWTKKIDKLKRKHIFFRDLERQLIIDSLLIDVGCCVKLFGNYLFNVSPEHEFDLLFDLDQKMLSTCGIYLGLVQGHHAWIRHSFARHFLFKLRTFLDGTLWPSYKSRYIPDTIAIILNEFSSSSNHVQANYLTKRLNSWYLNYQINADDLPTLKKIFETLVLMDQSIFNDLRSSQDMWKQFELSTIVQNKLDLIKNHWEAQLKICLPNNDRSNELILEILKKIGLSEYHFDITQKGIRKRLKKFCELDDAELPELNLDMVKGLVEFFGKNPPIYQLTFDLQASIDDKNIEEIYVLLFERLNNNTHLKELDLRTPYSYYSPQDCHFSNTIFLAFYKLIANNHHLQNYSFSGLLNFSLEQWIQFFEILKITSAFKQSCYFHFYIQGMPFDIVLKLEKLLKTTDCYYFFFTKGSTYLDSNGNLCPLENFYSKLQLEGRGGSYLSAQDMTRIEMQPIEDQQEASASRKRKF